MEATDFIDAQIRQVSGVSKSATAGGARVQNEHTSVSRQCARWHSSCSGTLNKAQPPPIHLPSPVVPTANCSQSPTPPANGLPSTTPRSLHFRKQFTFEMAASKDGDAGGDGGEGGADGGGEGDVEGGSDGAAEGGGDEYGL